MDAIEVLRELHGRVPAEVRRAVDGLTAEQLATPPAEGANTIGWLVWHLARVEDSHVAEVAGPGLAATEQRYVADGWAGRLGLPADPDDTGFRHGPEQVLAVRPDPDALLAYCEAVHEATLRFLDGLEPGDLDRVIDRSWDPPVTLGVRLVSVCDDAIQHAGQAAYARGMLGIDVDVP